jgi:hypothetical protein
VKVPVLSTKLSLRVLPGVTFNEVTSFHELGMNVIPELQWHIKVFGAESPAVIEVPFIWLSNLQIFESENPFFFNLKY